MWKTATFLIICLILTSCSSPQPREIPIPSCDQPIPITEEIWNDLDLVREVMSDNALIYQECIQKYRSRIELFNDS